MQALDLIIEIVAIAPLDRVRKAAEGPHIAFTFIASVFDNRLLLLLLCHTGLLRIATGNQPELTYRTISAKVSNKKVMAFWLLQ